jgi:hypothetical protein
MVLPAPPRFDILYAFEYSAPFRDDLTALSWHHFPSVPDRRHRIEVFADAYGLEDVGDLVSDVASVQRRVGTFMASLADRGLQPQADWVADGALAWVEKQAQWTEAHLDLFQ